MSVYFVMAGISISWE